LTGLSFDASKKNERENKYTIVYTYEIIVKYKKCGFDDGEKPPMVFNIVLQTFLFHFYNSREMKKTCFLDQIIMKFFYIVCEFSYL
jgi:hypothetical protein